MRPLLLIAWISAALPSAVALAQTPPVRPTPAPAGVDVSREQLSQLVQRYRRTGSRFEAKEQILSEAIPLGPPAANMLLPLVRRDVETALAQYDRLLLVHCNQLQARSPADAAERSEMLRAAREQLVRLGRLAQQLRDLGAAASPPNASGTPLPEFEAFLAEREKAVFFQTEVGQVYRHLDAEEIAAIEGTNDERVKAGLPPLTIDLRLCLAARDHSKDMETKEFFDHVSPVPGKEKFSDRAQLFGTTASAENLAMTSQGGLRAVDRWMNSEGHRKNILGEHRRIGVGRSGSYYTQLFGR